MSHSPIPRNRITSDKDWDIHYQKVDRMYLAINSLREENNNLQFRLEIKSKKCEELEKMYNEACEVTLEYQSEFQKMFESLNE